MVALTLASSVSQASADVEDSPKVIQAGERSGSLDLNVSHSNLDQAKAAGLTIKEETQQDKRNAQGTDAIIKPQKNISDDYANQAEADYQKN